MDYSISPVQGTPFAGKMANEPLRRFVSLRLDCNHPKLHPSQHVLLWPVWIRLSVYDSHPSYSLNGWRDHLDRVECRCACASEGTGY